MTHIDPCHDGIRSHTCIKHIPQWPDNSAAMVALRTEMQANGCRVPVHMTPKQEITDADSRERWRAAKALQLGKIPVVIEESETAHIASLQALIMRRHLTKSALAYLAYPILKPALEEARARRYGVLKNSENAHISRSELNSLPGLPKNIEELAELFGVNRHYVFDAKKVHEIFAKDAAYKAQMEPRILCEPIGGEHEQHRPVGLGAVIAGFEGKKQDRRVDHAQLELFGRAVRTFCIRAPQIADEAAARRIVRDQLDKVTPEELENIQRTAAMIASEARAISKGAGK